MKNNWVARFAGSFNPFLYVMVMATGISSNLMYDFVYKAQWLRYCSYPMFALACLLFIALQIQQMLHMFKFIADRSFSQYFDEYFRNVSQSVFWGTYAMGLMTIVNYIASLAQNAIENAAVARRAIKLVYVLWWFDVAVSLVCAWGLSFLIWQKFQSRAKADSYRTPNEQVSVEGLRSVLVLLVVPLVVAASSSASFTMTDLFSATFTRTTQLTVLVVTSLIWLHAVIFVFIIITIFFWSLYVNKIPPMGQVFSMFLILGPMGQASYGILLLTDDVRLYVTKYYSPSDSDPQYNILLLTIPWIMKIIGLLVALALLAMGYFFTIIGFAAVASYYGTTVEEELRGRVRHKRIYHFHKGWFAMTFPMGTMSLGSSAVWSHYNQFVPLLTFRVIGAIYAVICILWTIVCLTGMCYTAMVPGLRYLLNYIKSRDLPSDLSTAESKGFDSLRRSEAVSQSC